MLLHIFRCNGFTTLSRHDNLGAISAQSRRSFTTKSPLLAIKGVIFDMDGTLTPPGNIDFVALRNSINAIASTDSNYAEISSVEGRDVLETCQMLSPAGQKDAGKVLKELEDKCRINMKLTPGALSTLQYLKSQKVRASVVTRNVTPSLEHLEKILESHGITLDPMIARDTIHFGSIIKPKPHPEALNLIIKKWGFKSDEVIMVGDSLQDDIMAANLAKCKSCWIDTGIDNATGRGQEGKPDWVVERIGDVERVIDDYNKNN
ncbi:hypothetical protein TrLO_g2680 [Triparma laevis f. longispina]|uniref:Uncharacterized protein n=1 Tax=Triparma laevis f. longispina TaxID=1714387 RepID=A0A9W6ZNY1_9STRA|nr:hypothetical protein TrLO_g2680 [Triparma laevis f. longispina]